ncbi:hypothetical protein [Hansschlegelia sp.]|uniref:hypothetical protein n=1 Tax=Hansschlegelia sp. TaxID=2041892 RepID=UPI002CA80529|nr:hypothetical protein [Hansschlegelia sp.]HVI28705.1 hypothetical protein [Hansschlegelia sp.]
MAASEGSEALREGLRLLDEKDNVGAERLLARAVDAYPHDLITRFYLGISLRKLKKYDESDRQFSILLREACRLPPVLGYNGAPHCVLRLVAQLSWSMDLTAIDPSFATIDGLLTGDATDADAVDAVRDLQGRQPGLPYSAWLYVYARFLRRGFGGGAFAAKSAAGRVAITLATGGDRAAAPAAVLGAVYLGEFELAHQLCDRIAAEGGRKAVGQAHALRLEVLLSEGRVEEAVTLRRTAFKQRAEHQRYEAFIKGRSVALVGPAPNTLGNGREIDRHDVVARTNYQGAFQFLDKSENFGSRTDVSYYNRLQIGRSGAEIVQNLADEGIPFVVARKKSAALDLRAKLPASVAVRKWWARRWWGYFGNGFAFRHIIFDLLLFSPERITVFNGDFFLGEKPHFPSYWSTEIDVVRSYIMHDVFECFLFMKRLKEAGQIDGDAVLEQIIDLPVEDFLALVSRRCAAATQTGVVNASEDLLAQDA